MLEGKGRTRGAVGSTVGSEANGGIEQLPGAGSAAGTRHRKKKRVSERQDRQVVEPRALRGRHDDDPGLDEHPLQSVHVSASARVVWRCSWRVFHGAIAR